jgi:peroxiredoxin Q/BCP
MASKQRIVMLLASMAVAATVHGGEMIEPGTELPAFSLAAHDGSTVSSEQLQGTAYLLYFYPKADTPGCTKEACAFRDSWAEVQASGLKVFGVSYDTPKTNAAFAEKYSLQFPLLSDSERELAAAVGAQRALIPVPKRISYLVGADGKVLKVYPEVSPAEHAAEVLADFKQLGG